LLKLRFLDQNSPLGKIASVEEGAFGKIYTM